MDERNQNIKNKVWIHLKWTNELLRWDVRRWDNITFAQMDPSELWTPDIVLYNNVDDESEGGTDYKTRIRIYPNGTSGVIQKYSWFLPQYSTRDNLVSKISLRRCHAIL